jgi:hypothetical protein
MTDTFYRNCTALANLRLKLFYQSTTLEDATTAGLLQKTAEMMEKVKHIRIL